MTLPAQSLSTSPRLQLLRRENGTIRCGECGQLHTPPKPGHVATIERRALTALAKDLEGCHEDVWRFFTMIFSSDTNYTSVKKLCRDMAVTPSTFLSRFYRQGLPTPKQYLGDVQLVRLASLLEGPVSVAVACYQVGASSPQSLGRTVRTRTKLTANGFRARYTGDSMLALFRERMILPHQLKLRTFAPLSEAFQRPAVAK